MLSSDFNVDKNIEREFRKKLHWFEEEFKLIFEDKTYAYTTQDIKNANLFLDKLSEIINDYRDENLLYLLASTLNKIEREYPEFFN